MASEGSESKIPNWYCPFKVPQETIGSLSPLVYLAGLHVEKNHIHRGIWEIIKVKPSAKDFTPTYVDVPLNHKFPGKKQKYEHIENYVPRGILKTNWLNKHLNLIPAVVVAFFDMNWTDPHWNDKKNELAKRVRELKSDLASHGTQILVMLIKTADAGEDNFSTDRASALCAAADIPPKALYILSHTHSERIQACVQRLEIGMKEAAKAYYSGRIRRVKNWKDRALNTALLTRYNFKAGFFHEIRRDYVSSLTHYQAAHDILQTIKVTESNIQQIRAVSSWIIYRICRLNLLKLDYKEAQNQFEKHIRMYRRVEGNREIIFEHYAWLQQQYHYFGDLLRHFYRNGATTLDPVTYYQTSVEYSGKREQFCVDIRSAHEGEMKWPEEMEKYRTDVCDVEYVGQRPWRLDAFGPDTIFVPEDSHAIQALKCIELNYNHSEDRITNLGNASDFCRDHQRLRTRCQLMMMMGIECFTMREYHRSVMLMTHVLREFGREKLPMLLYPVADCGLKASCCDGDVASYLSFLVFLLKKDFVTLQFINEQRREVLWSNLLTVLDKKIPLPETGCVVNEEKWTKALATPYTSYVGVHREGILDAGFYFASETVRASAPAEVRVALKSNADFPITISKVGAGISINEYNCETPTDFTLEPGETHELSLFFTPLMKDAGKIIQIHMCYVDIGRPQSSIILHHSALTSISPYLWNDGNKDKSKQIVAKIEHVVPLLVPRLVRADCMLINEWHRIHVKWTNNDTVVYTKVTLTFMVAASDPRDIIVTTNPKTQGKFGSLIHTIDIPTIAPEESISTMIFVKCLNCRGNELQFVTKAKYVDDFRQTITNELVEPIEVIRPFEVVQNFRSLQCDSSGYVLSNEEFTGNFHIKNMAKTPLLIVNAKITGMAPNYTMSNLGQYSEIHDALLVAGEVEQVLNTFIMSYPMGNGPMGTLEILWKREYEDDDVPPCLTEISITPVVTSPNAIYVEGIFNNKGLGELKKPMIARYVIHNRSTRIYDVLVCLDSTECFMNAGPRRIRLKLTALEHVNLQYVLFPLKTGLVKTPRVIIEHTFVQTDSGAGDVPSVVHKNVVKYIFVTRAEAGSEDATSQTER